MGHTNLPAMLAALDALYRAMEPEPEDLDEELEDDEDGC